MNSDFQCTVRPTPEPIAELDRLGDQIAELSAHLDAATARLLELIREFDARGGWNNGFLSCAHWLCYRVAWRCGPRGSACVSPARSVRCRDWRRRSPAVSCRTPRSGR